MEPFSFPFFFLIFVAAIGEFILSAFWVPFYFRFGIPLYRRSYRLTEAPADWNQQIPALEAQLPSSWWKVGVVFRALGPQELAFRQSMKRNSRNVLHGRLHFDALTQELTITGYMYWSLFLIPLFFVFLTAMQGAGLIFGIFILFIILFNIGITRISYQRIATVIQKQFQTTSWTEPSPTRSVDGSFADPFAPTSTKPPGLTTLEIMLAVVLLIMFFVTGAVFVLYWLGR